jgi:hypothetical protein
LPDGFTASKSDIVARFITPRAATGSRFCLSESKTPMTLSSFQFRQLPKLLIFITGSAWFAWSSPAALAQAAGAWEPGVTLAPYGWLAGFDGTAGVSSDQLDPGGGLGLPDRIDVKLDGELEEIGFMFFADWRGERWEAMFDSVWVNVSQDASISLGQILPGTTIDATIDGNIYLAAVGLRMHDWSKATISTFAGLRYYDLEATISASDGLLPQSVSTSGSRTWTDGVLGMRLAVALFEQWRLSALVDLGAGGSDFSGEALVTLGYRLPWFSVVGGYRHMTLDYDKENLLIDATLSGPLLGVSISF